MYTNMFAFLKPVKKSVRPLLAAAMTVLATCSAAAAHVSEMGLVLLMPTGVYIWAGVWVVALTALGPRRAAAPMDRGDVRHPHAGALPHPSVGFGLSVASLRW